MVAWETVAFAMAIRYSRGDLAGTPIDVVAGEIASISFPIHNVREPFRGIWPKLWGSCAVPLVGSNVVQSKLDAGSKRNQIAFHIVATNDLHNGAALKVLSKRGVSVARHL